LVHHSSLLLCVRNRPTTVGSTTEISLAETVRRRPRQRQLTATATTRSPRDPATASAGPPPPARCHPAEVSSHRAAGHAGEGARLSVPPYRSRSRALAPPQRV